MYIDKKTEKKIPISKDQLNGYYVVTDFDRTITNGASKTSWSILSESDLVPKSYAQERQELYDYYRPIEIDESLDFTMRSALVSEWYRKHIDLFVKYKLSEEVFIKAGSDLRVMQFRDGAKDFLAFLHDNNIPLIIISAGIGNFIECFLQKNNCYYDNIYICSNRIIFKDGVAVGVDTNITHSLNKNEVALPEEIKKKLVAKKHVILLGDQESDLRMVDSKDHKSVINIGFFSTRTETPYDEYIKYFDIVCNEEYNYKVLMKKLFR